MKKCAILTMDNLDDFEAYDELIFPHLKDLGWKASFISWHNQKVNWNDYQAVIIRSPWDYQDNAEQFLQVLKNIQASSAHLENSLAIIEWNIDKIYLRTLEKNKVNIVPTLWRDNFEAQQLESYFSHFGQQQIVIKPRISANADNTFWLKQENYNNHINALTEVFANRQFMVQPFMQNIVDEGEYSLFYFNGQYSHAILKSPKANDFRVQEEHGGQIVTIAPDSLLLEEATNTMQVLSSIHQVPLYARVDFVRDQQGFALMEAELIEPSLYFNMDSQSAKRFALAFEQRMNSL
jgi:hypothetical protein